MSQDHPHHDADQPADPESRCSRFQAAWANWLESSEPDQPRPNLRDYVVGLVGNARRLLLVKLIRIDAATRREQGEVPRVQGYTSLFPNDLPAIEEALLLSGNQVARGDALHAPDVRHPEPVAQQIGRYLIKRPLGEGGFGTVYLAEDPGLAQLVAIKVPKQDRVNEEICRRFVDELQTAAKLRTAHPLIVPVWDHGQLDDGRPYAVMQYIDGQPLDQLLHRGELPPARAAQITQQLADALHAAHQLGFVHRDIKPANILLDGEGQPHLTDFGLTIHEAEQHLKAGDASGTIPYRAPEQVRGEANWMDGRADIWALGVVLYEMLTGRRPFGGANHAAVSEEICHRAPKSPRTIDDRIPISLQAICLICLEKRPEDRYSAADELAMELSRTVAELTGSHAGSSPRSGSPTMPNAGTPNEVSILPPHAPAASKRFFLSYPHGDPDEVDLARSITQGLNDAGHECFIDERMSLGTDWVRELNRRLHWCDYLVVLLSENSMHSEMVQAEVRIACQLFRQVGRPRVLPIRVRYFGSLEYELDLYLGRLQHIRWQGPSQTKKVLNEVQRAITVGDVPSTDSLPAERLSAPGRQQKSARPSAVADSRSAIVPGGTIRAEDPFYVRRPQDDVVVECAAESGITLVVKGARQMGKSSLLMHYLSKCQAAGKKVAFVDFSIFTADDFREYPTFLSRFAQVLLHRLGLERSLADHVDSQFAMVDFVESQLLPTVSRPMVIAIDEADRLLGQPYQADFFSMLRVWHNNRSMFLTPQWEHLDVALAISTEPYLLIEEGDRSPFNVGRILEVTPFNLSECQVLNARYPGVLSDDQVDQLWQLLGGHPYLTRLAYYRLTSADKLDLKTLINIAADERGPFGDHLRTLVFKLHERPELLAAMKQIIQNGAVDRHDLYYRLCGAGLVRREGDRINPANLLYARHFRRAL